MGKLNNVIYFAVFICLISKFENIKEVSVSNKI